MLLTTTRLDKPRNQTAHLLFEMIRGRMVSEQQSGFNSFRSRLSELRNNHALPILYVDEPFTNRFNRSGTYRKHFLTEKGREKAIEVYEKINK